MRLDDFYPEALDAAKRMQHLANGPMLTDIEQLNQAGQLLADRETWDGPRAQRFRSEWQGMHVSLMEAQKAICQLRVQANEILLDVLAAGGMTR